MRVPTLVTKPFTFSDLSDDRARVEPGSSGANKARHSCRPLFKDARFSCKRLRSHSSSAAYPVINQWGWARRDHPESTNDSSSSLMSCSCDIGGQTAADMAPEVLAGTLCVDNPKRTQIHLPHSLSTTKSRERLSRFDYVWCVRWGNLV